MKRIAILFSGGVDSTATSALMVKQFDQIHLLSFKRQGLYNIERTETNAKLLNQRYGSDRFLHQILDITKLFSMVSYSQYLKSLAKYGFFVLSTCGACKLSMHIRALIYCLDNDIHFVADGANKHMYYFPDQTTEYIEEIKKMYSGFGISYLNPVFDFDCPEEDIDWIHKLGMETASSYFKKDGSAEESTTSQFLLDEGILDIPNAKAEKFNQNAQARCFQLMLFNIFLHWYFLPAYGISKYKKMTSAYYEEKIRLLLPMLVDYAEGKDTSLKKCLK